MQNISATITNFLTLGGPVVSILIALSVVALTVILMKCFQFLREKVGGHRDAELALRIWQSQQQIDAIQSLRGKRGLVNSAVCLTMGNLNRNAGSKADIEDAVSVLATDRLHKLQSGFRLLDAIVQIAPLLGLFGTVLGMINAFQKLQEAGNSVDPSILAGGIWVALLTTAVGLAVAMPVSLILTWFETRLESERVAVETSVGKLLNNQLQSDAQQASEFVPQGLARAT